MNELKENINIENMIYEIRGKQVMLDSDLAKLYQCVNGTKSINLAVKRNINRFPERFMFQLTTEEYDYLRFQSETTNNHMTRTLPYVFTEQGVAMLATILKTSVAVEVSIKIMDAFVLMRKYLASNSYERRISNIETKLIDYDKKFDEVFDKLEPTVNNHLFYNGQIYDAYSLLVDVLNSAKMSVILIDNYVDKKFLDIVSNIKVDVIIITGNKCGLTKIDIEKYNSEYNNLIVKYNSSFHDRFIIIDNNVLYHCGSSFKDLGKKCFEISKIVENEVLDKLKEKIRSIDLILQ